MKIRTCHLSVSLLALLLSGCQFLPTTQEPQISTPQIEIAPIHDVNSHDFWLTEKQNLVGSLAAIKARKNDTLPDIARHFGLGYNDIVTANPNLEPWLLEEGDKVLLPVQFILPKAERKGIVINLANMRMFYFPAGQAEQLITYPVGIGRDDWKTPTGLMKITTKKKKPSWSMPESVQREHAEKGETVVKFVPPGPNNPLGEYAMNLSKAGYLIHGTNKPYGVGMQVSHGCIRLYPEDISRLFEDVKVGTQVLVVEQPYLLAWEDGILYLEAHKPLQKNTDDKKKLLNSLKEIAKQKQLEVDWPKVDRIIEQATGVPTPVLTFSEDFDQLVMQAPLVDHPSYFYGQPTPERLTAKDWTLKVANFEDEKNARKISSLLNHQGPVIPARIVRLPNNSYDVIAGPFKTKKDATEALQKIQREFQITSKLNPPQTSHSNPLATSKPELDNVTEIVSGDAQMQLELELNAEESLQAPVNDAPDSPWFFEEWFEIR